MRWKTCIDHARVAALGLEQLLGVVEVGVGVVAVADPLDRQAEDLGREPLGAASQPFAPPPPEVDGREDRRHDERDAEEQEHVSESTWSVSQRKFWPKKLVTSVQIRKNVAITVSRVAAG